MRLNILNTTKTGVAVSCIISTIFLTTYFLQRHEVPTGPISNYALTFIEFNILLIIELGILICGIFWSLHITSQFLSVPSVAKILFKEKAKTAIAVLKLVPSNKNDKGVRLKIILGYISIVIAYFLLLLLVAYTDIKILLHIFAFLTVIIMYTGIISIPLVSSKEKVGPKRILFCLFSLIFSMGFMYCLTTWFLSVFLNFNTSYLNFASILLVLVFISSFGLINPCLDRITISANFYRFAVSVSALLLVFLKFNLFYQITAINLHRLGASHLPTIKIN